MITFKVFFLIFFTYILIFRFFTQFGRIRILCISIRLQSRLIMVKVNAGGDPCALSGGIRRNFEEEIIVLRPNFFIYLLITK